MPTEIVMFTLRRDSSGFEQQHGDVVRASVYDGNMPATSCALSVEGNGASLLGTVEMRGSGKPGAREAHEYRVLVSHTFDGSTPIGRVDFAGSGVEPWLWLVVTDAIRQTDPGTLIGIELRN